MSAEAPLKYTIPIGEVTPKKEIVSKLLDCINGKILTIDLIISAMAGHKVSEQDTILQVFLLLNSGIISPARPDTKATGHKSAECLNLMIMERSGSGDTHRFLASPVLGSAFPTQFVDRVVAPIVSELPKASDIEIADKAFDYLESSGQSFFREGKPLARTESTISDVAKLVGEFRKVRLPRWRALGAMP